MGVYIKGMEMPSGCLDCPLYNGYGCKATLQMFHPTTNVAVRVDSCPLVEVKTPHGRLIDADAEYKALSEMKVEGEVFVTAVEFAKIEMEQVQTVIEAEVE